MMTEFEDLFARLSDHERKLEETLGDVSEFPLDSTSDVNLGTARRSERDRTPEGEPSNIASDSLRLERALAKLGEGDQRESPKNRSGLGTSRFFSPEELAKAIQRGANVGTQQNERDRFISEAIDQLKSIDEKVSRLLEAGKERFF